MKTTSEFKIEASCRNSMQFEVLTLLSTHESYYASMITNIHLSDYSFTFSVRLVSCREFNSGLITRNIFENDVI
jgi:hypothetical protein